MCRFATRSSTAPSPRARSSATLSSRSGWASAVPRSGRRWLASRRPGWSTPRRVGRRRWRRSTGRRCSTRRVPPRRCTRLPCAPRFRGWATRSSRRWRRPMISSPGRCPAATRRQPSAATTPSHDVAVRASGSNDVIAQVLEQVTPVLRRVEFLRFSSLSGRESIAQHNEIDRCRQRDAAAAADATERNWQALSQLPRREGRPRVFVVTHLL